MAHGEVIIDVSMNDKDATQSIGRLETGLKGLTNKVVSGGKMFANMLGANLISAGVTRATSSAINTITQSIDGAISRVDTLDNANRVFENMGFSANDTKIMMNNLNDSITGLPTTLDGAIGNIQKLTSATQDIHGSEQIFSALNNAVLGFGGSASDVDSVVNMFSRSLARGQVMGDEWNTMFDQMAPVLNALADEMGYTVDELRTGLSDGTIEVDTFTDALLKMNEEGGGGLVSLEQIAQDSTKGIRTSMANAKTAITRGVATIFQNLNEGLESAGLPSISEMIGAYGTIFNKVLIGIANNLDPFINLVKTGVDSIKAFAEGFMSTNRIGNRLQNMFTNIRAAFSHVVSELFGGGGDITETFRNIGTAVSNAITPIVTFVSGINRYVRSLDIAGTKNAIFERLRSIIDSIDWSRLVDLATTLKDGVGNAIMFVVEKIQELWDGFKNTGAIDSIITAFGDFKEMIASNIESFSDLTGNMREGSFSFESIGEAIGKVVEVGAKLLSWLYKASSSVSKFLTKVNPNIILGVVGAFGAFKLLQNFNPFSIFQRNAEKGLGGITKSAGKGGGLITKIFNGIAKVIVSVGKSISQVLTGVSKVITSLARGISTIMTGLSKVITSVAKGISTVLKGLATSISTLAKGLSQSVAILIRSLSQGLSTAVKGIARAISLIPIPHMLAFAVAVAVVVAALTLLATQGDGVKKMLEGLGNAIATVVEAFGSVLVSVIEAFGRVIEKHGKVIIEIIESISEGFVNFAEAVGEAIATVIEAFEPLVEIIKEGFVEIAEIISDTIVEIVEILSDYLPDILEFWDGVIEKIPDIIDAFGRLSESIGRAIATIIEALGENAQGIIRAFGDVFEQAGGVVIGIINALNEALPNFESFVTAVIDAVGENLPPILDAFGEAFKDMGEAVEGIITTLGEQAPNFAGAVAIIIGEIGVQTRTTLRVFGETFDKMGKTVEGVINAFGEFHTTFSTNIGNLLDVIGDNATKVFDSFAEAFGEMADDVEDVIDKMSEHAETLGEVINGIIETLGEEITGVIESFTESFESIGTTIEGVIDKIGDTAGDIADAIEKIAEAFGKLDGVSFSKINGGLTVVASELRLIAKDNRAKAADTINDVADAINEFPDTTSFGSNLAAIALAMDTLSETAGASTHVKSLGEAASNHHEDISNVASALKSFPDLAPISSYLQSIGLALELIGTNGVSTDESLGNVSEKMSPLETGIKNVSEALTNLNTALNATRLQSGNTETSLDKLKQMIENLGQSTNETLTKMTNLFNTGLTSITNLVTQSSTAIQNVTTQTMNTVSNSISTGLRTIQTQFSNTLNSVNTIYSSAMNNVVSITTRTSNQVINSVRTMMNTFVSTIRNASNPIRSAMSSNINSALSVARSGISPMVYIGQQIGNGLARGMNSALGTIRRAAQNMINEANRAARAKAMIHSPSRLFEREIGRYLPEGVAVGIERSTPVAMQSMESMIDRLSSVRASAEDVLSVGGVSVSRQGSYRNVSSTQSIGGNSSTKAVENALNKSNELLSLILDKPTDVILDGKPITENVNRRNARSELINRMKGGRLANV